MKLTKKIVATVLLIVLLYAPIATILNFGVSIAANKTGNTAIIKFAGEKNEIDGLGTYSKNGVRSLDLFCAQKGTHIGSWGNYEFEEVEWEPNAGVFKDDASYKKITWIKDNFWEESDAKDGEKYTNEEKLEILKLSGLEISEDDVNAVFNNKNEKFKLYQALVWTYTAGNYYTVNISGSVRKVYDAINELAEMNYQNNDAKDIKIDAEDVVYNKDSKTYTWNVDITNTYVLP